VHFQSITTRQWTNSRDIWGVQLDGNFSTKFPFLLTFSAIKFPNNYNYWDISNIWTRIRFGFKEHREFVTSLQSINKKIIHIIQLLSCTVRMRNIFINAMRRELNRHNTHSHCCQFDIHLGHQSEHLRTTQTATDIQSSLCEFCFHLTLCKWAQRAIENKCINSVIMRWITIYKLQFEIFKTTRSIVKQYDNVTCKNVTSLLIIWTKES